MVDNRYPDTYASHLNWYNLSPRQDVWSQRYMPGATNYPPGVFKKYAAEVKVQVENVHD
jgi:hypothetical protein